MHTIRGRLTRAEHIEKAGMAMLSLTLSQVGAGGITAQPVEALMSYGNTPIGHDQARRACASLEPGGLYAVRGKGLSATGGQVWLLGVSHWHLIAPAMPAEVAATAPLRSVPGGERAGRYLRALAGGLDA